MKKYLMSGIAAIALCAAFTSCSKENLYDENAVIEKNEMAVRESYAQAFEKAFGKVGANVDWGFGSSRSNTRNHGQDGAINVNGNMWTECPGVRVENDEEVNAIFNYVKNGTEWMTQNNKPFSTTAPQNLNGYFVTQVRSGNNNYADNTYPLTYKQNGGTLENVGQYMNHLQIALNQNPSMADLNSATSHDNISGWEHINNFNASANIDWGNPESAEKGNTKVENKGAFDFAYHSSYDDQYHNKWILVDGADISNDPYYADFYYVCFDFESVPKGNTTFYTYKDGNGQSQNGELVGTYFSNEELAAELAKQGITDRNDISIYRYMNGDKMVKGDNKYTDWIIRITKGEPEIVETASYRVIAEDLTADEASDFDFNDVVFDVEPNEAGTAAKIVLRAAGGIYRLTVAGQEVHEAFAAAYPEAGYGIGNNGLYPMINTNPWNPEVKVTLFEAYSGDFSVNNIRNTIKDIEIKVYKPGYEENGLLLTATTGQAACKILVDNTFEVVTERTGIADRNVNFHKYVQGYFDGEFWWKRGNRQ